MKSRIKCGYNCDSLYKSFLLSSDKSIDNLLHSFEDSSLDYCAFILEDGSYDLKETLPYTKVVYVTEGNISVQVNDLSTVLLKNHFLFVNAHSKLKIKSSTKDTSCFTLLFKKQFFHPNFMKKLSEFEVFYNFINFCLMGKIDNKAHLLYKSSSFVINQMLYIMLSLVDNGESGLLESALLFLFEYLYKSDNSILLAEFSTLINTSIANSITKYIAANYNDITLVSLSEYFNYHPNYISSLIHRETGKTFQQHVQDAKLKKAAYLLVNTDSYIKDIIYGLGYVETSYFNRIFRKTYSCTPSEYRANHREKG